MANQNAQPATPSAQPALQGTEAAPPAQNILEDVCEIEGQKVESTTMIERPPLGETREVSLQEGQNYIFGFAKADADSFIVDQDGTLTITFECGGSLILKNYSAVTSGDETSTFAFSDIIPQGELSSMIKVVDTTPAEEEVQPEDTAKNEKTARAEQVANIEPAAGDEAAMLAQIEPAAGEAGGAAGGNSGYGFNTPYTAASVGPLSAVGPLGQTSLQYGANFRQPNPLIGEEVEDDDRPTAEGPAEEFLDETNLAGGPIVETGFITFSFGNDAPGTITPVAAGGFTSGGSKLGGNLTSEGHPVNVVVNAAQDGYDGIANGQKVFTLVIDQTTGEYTFTLLRPLDHNDATDPNDVIDLNFDVLLTDADGDELVTQIVVHVADDAPTLDGDGTKSVDEDDIPGASVSGNLIENFGQDNDAPANIHTTGVWNATGDMAGGVLRSGGENVNVTFNGTTYTGTTTGGTPVFTLTITNQQTGAYTFNLLQPLDHSAGGNTITLTFGAEIIDFDGDTDTANIVIDIKDDVPDIKDDNPQIGKGLEVIDETDMNGASITKNGNLPHDDGADTPSVIAPNGNTQVNGSFAGPNLTSNGDEVIITQTANGYKGETAGGRVVFTFTINDNGAYSFTLNDQLDHANGADPNDVINLRFGVKITDNDGDTDDGFVNVNIVDDAPVLDGDGIKTVDEDDIPGASVSGNLVEDFGEDGQGFINTTGTSNATGDLDGGVLRSGGENVNITFGPNGYTGTTTGGTPVFTLTIDPDTGAYTFNLLQPLDHSAGGNTITLTFGAKIVDFDGDSDLADIVIKIKDDVPEIKDDNPVIGKGLEVVDETNLGPIVRDGSVTFDFGGDGPGAFGPSGTSSSSIPLTSGGNTVTVTPSGTGYVGTANGQTIFTMAINPDGTYKFTLIGTLDHPVDGPTPADHDDVITLNFGVRVTDADGDSDTGNIIVRVHDDGPVAVDDGNFTDGNTVTGNVLGNDDHGEDGPGAVISVTFNGTTTPVPAVGTVNINGAHGVLTIAANGEYSYTPNNGTDGSDVFTYTMNDNDGATDTAKLTIRVDNDDKPIIIKPAAEVVDETFLGPIVETGTVDADFFGDGPGTIKPDGITSSSGSKLNGNLTSLGETVTITQTANGYVGTVNGGATNVFTLTIDPATGDYTFTLNRVLDHQDGSNPNDVITLNFGVVGTDSDGDTASTSITVNVVDDAPIAKNDVNTGEGVRTGNVVTGANGGAGAADDLSNDTPNKVTKIAFGGTSVNVPNAGEATINGQYGQLKISADGSYTYTPFALPYQGGGTTSSMSPGASNFTGIQNTVTKNGITVKSANGADLTWYDNGDGGGIGIAPDNIYTGEKLEVDFAASDKVTITIADLGTNNKQGGIDYVVHLANGQTVTGEFDVGPVPHADGIASFTLNSSSFGGQQIVGVDLSTVANSALPIASFTVQNIIVSSHDCPPDQGPDQFVYTLTDRDGDSSTATLTVEGNQPILVVGENVDDKSGSKIEHRIGCDHGEIIGKRAADILIGDVGGSKQIAQNKDFNVVLILDISGSMGEGPGSKLQLLKDAVSHLLQDFNNYDTGTIKVHVVPFGTTAFASGTFTVTDTAGYNSAVSFVQAMDNNNQQFTNYEAPMISALNWLNGNLTNDPIANADTYTYFVSDGEPNHYVGTSGQTVNANNNAQTVMNEIHGVSDGSDEVGQLQAKSQLVAVGIDISGTTLARLDTIDENGDAVDVQNANDLDAAFQNLNPLNQLTETGDDVLTGGDGNDLIFGDTINTDALATAQGLSTNPGAGWQVIELLEAGLGTNAAWDRDDTIAYIKANAVAMSDETVSNGQGRQGGNDTLSGGAGNDIIFGQEGDDVITGGAGNDTLYGGSGDDVFKFVNLGGEGVDTVKDFEIGDILDVSGLLVGYNSVQDSINDFVFKTESGGNTTIHVNADGVGGLAGATAIATLEGIVGLNIQQITNDGNAV